MQLLNWEAQHKLETEIVHLQNKSWTFWNVRSKKQIFCFVLGSSWLVFADKLATSKRTTGDHNNLLATQSQGGAAQPLWSISQQVSGS